MGLGSITLRDTIYVSQATNYPPLPPSWAVNPADYLNTGEINAEVIVDLDTMNSGYLGAFVRDSCRGIAESILSPPTGDYIFSLINKKSGHI